MITQRNSVLVMLVLALIMMGVAPVWAQAPLKVGEVLEYHAESPHPYPPGGPDRPVVWTDTVSSPGATFLRIHLVGVHLAPGDYLTVSNPDGSDFWTYTGRGPHGHGAFWSFAVEGDTANIEIHAGPRSEHGYRIDLIGHGTVDIGRPSPTPEVVCGDDGREDVACHLSEIDAAQKPVARVHFEKEGSFFLCTAALVSGSNANTMMTNNHCFSTQTQVESVQAKFNFQRTICGFTENAVTTDYAGGTLLKTNSISRKRKKGGGFVGGLDYTLFTLSGSPETAWGELVATTKSVMIGDLIWFIQHPGGNEKKIGYWEDMAKKFRCKVDRTNQTYSSSASGSQLAYACDSQNGSSGSPITIPPTIDKPARVIALHHFGGVTNDPCLNAGTEMPEICTDAGSLLSCD